MLPILQVEGSVLAISVGSNVHREIEAGLLNKRLMLSSNFRCDQIYKYKIHDFGHTLLCHLSRT
jgi:hypothetical protein